MIHIQSKTYIKTNNKYAYIPIYLDRDMKDVASLLTSFDTRMLLNCYFTVPTATLYFRFDMT